MRRKEKHKDPIYLSIQDVPIVNFFDFFFLIISGLADQAEASICSFPEDEEEAFWCCSACAVFSTSY